MSALDSLPGIGPVMAARLTEAGILNAEQLREEGAKAAFLKLKSVYPDACLSSLYGMACAAQGVPRGSLSMDEKSMLKSFFHSL